MSAPKSWSIFLLAFPALALGWLLGGNDEQASTNPSKATASDPTAIAPPIEFPDFFAADSSGRNPSYVEVSLRLLNKAQTASAREWRQLRKEVGDARYHTDPGYDFARWAIESNPETQHREPIRADEIPAASRRAHFLTLGKRDLRAGFEIAIQSEPEALRASTLSAVFASAGKHPELALELLRSISDPLLRAQVAHQPVVAAARSNPSIYLELVAEFPHLEASIYESAIGEMAKTDPEKALAAYENVPPLHQATTIQELLSGWGKKDHAAAFAWANDNGVKPPPWLFHNWARADPVAALKSAVAGDFSRSRNSGSGLDALVATATEDHPENQEKVAEWLLGLEDTSLATRLSAGLLSGTEPPSDTVMRAARIAAEHPDCDRQSLSGFVERIRNPAERRDWIQALPPIVGRQMMVQQARRWLRDDPDTFGEYVEALPSARAQANFVRNAIVASGGVAPDALRAWATSNLDAEIVQRIERLGTRQ